MQKLSQKINGIVNLQDCFRMCYHCNTHLKVGHGHEERHRKKSYVVFIPKKYSHFALYSPVGKNNKMNKMSEKNLKVLLFTSYFPVDPNFFQINF